MPIYEFRCEPCKANFEELVRSSSTKVVCPTCGTRKVTRLLSSFAQGGRSLGPSAGDGTPSSSAGGGCGGCHGGSCSTCH